MELRAVRYEEHAEVFRMMKALWPDFDDAELVDDEVLVIARDGGGLGGFIALMMRPWAEGCASTPVAYIEGWWIDEDLRRQGWGRRLVEAAERWARDRGCPELASDVELDNARSIAAHVALGFTEVQRSVCFAKKLDGKLRPVPCDRTRPDVPGLHAACAVAADAGGASRPPDDELHALFDRILFAPQPHGRDAWRAFRDGLILEVELRNLLLAHLETMLERREGRRISLVDLRPAQLECFDRALFGRPTP
jgi:aminoglycoside 6'-N-acetyltransferase I